LIPKYDTSTNQDYQNLNSQLQTALETLRLLKQEAANAGAELHKDFGEEAVNDLLAANKQFDDAIKKTNEFAQNFQKFIGENRQISSLSGETTRPGGAGASLMGIPIPTDQDISFMETAGAKSTQAFKSLNAQMMVNIETDQRVAQQGQEDAKRYQEAWTRARDTMANQLNSFFDELTTGNIGAAFLRQFEKMVSEMVATWLMGIRGMQQSVTRPGGLFGTLFGLGSGSGFFGGGDLTNPAYPAGGALSGVFGSGSLGGGAFSFAPDLTGPVADMSLPLSAGGGGSGLGLSTLPTGGAALGPGMAGLGGGGFLSKFLGGGGLGSLAGMGLLAGVASLGVGFNSPGQGALTGALGTGLGMGALAFLGTEIPGLFGAGEFAAAALSGPFFPITLGVGALIGGLVGLFTGHGKRKKEQTAVLQQMEQQLNNLQNAFALHQVDYNSAINQAEQIRQSFTAQQEQIQQGGGPSRVDPWVNATETYINNIEAQRQNVLSAVGGYGPAQFSAGGFVHPSLSRLAPAGFAPAMAFAMGGAVPAIVHAGEYVLNAGAVTRIGVGNLDSMNAGGFGGMHVHLNINAVDGKSVEELFRPGGEAWRALSRNITRAMNEGY
jgi:hypothetical protein